MRGQTRDLSRRARGIHVSRVGGSIGVGRNGIVIVVAQSLTVLGTEIKCMMKQARCSLDAPLVSWNLDRRASILIDRESDFDTLPGFTKAKVPIGHSLCCLREVLGDLDGSVWELEDVYITAGGRIHRVRVSASVHFRDIFDIVL